MTNAKPTALVDESAVVKSLGKFLGPGQVVELRVLDAVTVHDRRPHIVSGYFDDPLKLAKAAATVVSAKGFYITANPVNPALLARAANRARAVGKEPTTSDRDIVKRLWLLIDCDPVRPAGISSTDEEHRAATETAYHIRAALAAEGWPDPIIADSGNGAHLLYRIDLPTDDDGLVDRCLAALAARFNTPGVTIDVSVGNPARIWRLYGTRSCKGDDTPERPHRMSCILESPKLLGVVDAQLLEALAASGPSIKAATAPSKSHVRNGSGIDLTEWIKSNGIETQDPEPWKDGQKWVLKTCPWNSDHTNRSAYIVQQGNGAISAGCQHNGCKDKKWHDLRDIIEPGWRNRNGSAFQEASPAANGIVGQVEPATIVDDEWPAPPDPAVYHGLAGEIIRTVMPHSEADPLAILSQLLTAFGNAIGREPHCRAESDRHVGKLFVALVGKSSKGRKGTSWGYVRRIFAAVDSVWTTDRVSNGLSSGEGLIWAVRDPIFKREAVKEKGRVVGYEEVEADSGVADKRLLVLESELGSVLRVVRRESNTLSAVIRDAWDRDHLATMTKNSPAKSTGCHISIVGHITRDELRRHITETDMANGFANRFLWLCVGRSKCLPEGGNLDDQDLAPFVSRLRDAIDFASSCGLVRRNQEASVIWAQVYPQLSEGKAGLLGAVTGRAESQVLRLSLLYALLDQSKEVRADHLLAALAFWDYAEASARYIFGSNLGDPTADEIMRLLRVRPEGVTREEIRNHFQRHTSSAEIGRALKVLAESGMARFEQEQTGGRPAERWFSK